MNKPYSLTNDKAEEWAKAIGLDFITNFSKFEYIVGKKTPLPFSFVQKHHILPLCYENGFVLIAVADPYKLDAIKEARFILRHPVKEVLSTKELIQSQMEDLYLTAGSSVSEDSKNEAYLELNPDLFSEASEYDLLENTENTSVISILNKILIEALKSNASDIHFEPLDKVLCVKFRVDGILFEKHILPKSMESQIISRLKVQAELDIAESRMPQDGRIKLKMGAREIDFRLSSVPVIFGERIVLRISDNSDVLLGLDNLELREDFLRSLREDISKKQGIILVTGPTGSGKTRTLYSALSEIAGGELNIMTIEDPVENKLKNLAQINVNQKRGLTFAKGLKHILRQDPDVIMIGEIRDKETVSIAIEASLTGHLVFATLHTNDAPSTIVRLTDMGVEPYLISSSLISVCSQRLVRKLCKACGAKEGVKEHCPDCSGSGFKGRRGIYEYLRITPAIKRAITSTSDAMKLTNIALEEGMQTLYQDGMRYVEQGITTEEEIKRVTSALKGE